MIPRKYLATLDANDYDIPGIFGIPHARKQGSWRIVCSYGDGQRYKEKLFAKLAAAGQQETRGTWEFHHVVEGQHYADVDYSGRLPALYADELPCVLIAKEEHLAYNRLLHIRETDELYRGPGLPKDLRDRSAAAVEAARDPKNHPRLRADVEKLKRLYSDAYQGDPVLTAIARNVLHDAEAALR